MNRSHAMRLEYKTKKGGLYTTDRLSRQLKISMSAARERLKLIIDGEISEEMLYIQRMPRFSRHNEQFILKLPKNVVMDRITEKANRKMNNSRLFFIGFTGMVYTTALIVSRVKISPASAYKRVNSAIQGKCLESGLMRPRTQRYKKYTPSEKMTDKQRQVLTDMSRVMRGEMSFNEFVG